MTLDNVLDNSMELPLNEREILIDILKKRVIEERRKELSQYYNTVKKEFQDGRLTPKSAEDAIIELENYLQNEE